MNCKILVSILLLFFSVSTFAQNSKEQRCIDMKTQADTAYSVFEIELLNSQIFKKEENWLYPYFYSYFRQYKELIGTDCLTPDEREVVIKRMNVDLGQLLSQAVYLYEIREYDRAMTLFTEYTDFCESDIASEENRQEDLIRQIKYYAVICSAQTDKNEQTIQLAENLINSDTTITTIYGGDSSISDVYYMLAEEYKKVRNDTKCIETLYLTMSRFPEQEIICLSLLVNSYIENQNYTEAMVCLDRMLQVTPKQKDAYFEYLNLKANLFVHLREYYNAEGLYQAGLKDRPDDERLQEGLGVAYAIHAQELNSSEVKGKKEKKKRDKLVRQYYSKALVELERYKALLTAKGIDLEGQKNALNYLRTVYYYMGDMQSYDTIDNLLNP